MICARFPSQAAFGATSLLYHIRFDLSRGFSKVFSKFFNFFSSLASRRKCPTIISHLFSFVKRFFKSFFNFFRDLFGGLLFAKQLAYCITSLLFCQEVFQKFFQLFSRYFVSLSRFDASIRRSVSPRSCAPLLDSLHIIALRLPIVNPFFRTFLTLVRVAVCHNFPADRLCIMHIFSPPFAFSGRSLVSRSFFS